MSEIKLTEAQIRSLLPKGVDFDTFLAEIKDKDETEQGDALFGQIKARFAQVGKDRENGGISKKAKAIEKVLAPIIEKYGIEADTTEEQLRLLNEALEAEPPKGSGTLTKEELLKNNEVKAIIAERLNAANLAYQAEKATLESKLKEQSQASTKAKALALIAHHLTEKKAVLGNATPQTAAEIALNLVGIDNVGEVMGPDGKAILVLVDTDGAPITDALGAQIPLTAKVESTWAFGFNKADPTKQGGGAPSPGGNAGNTGSSVTITSKEQANELLSLETDPKKRSEIFEAVSKL